MQRKSKTPNLGLPDALKEVELMPFQNKFPGLEIDLSGIFTPPRISGIEQAKAAFPIFGGTAPTPPATVTDPPATDPPKADPPATTTGGDADKPPMTPEQINDLLSQVTQLNTQVTQLTKTNQTYEQEKETARQATLGREEALTESLATANATIEAMDSVIRYVALVNAIQNNPDIKFHDVNFVMSKLDENGFDFTVDLDNKKAEVKGIENELKRIAAENAWAVKNEATTQQQAPPVTRTRSSGAPPVNAPTDASKLARRKDLMTRFPVIGHGKGTVTPSNLA